MKFLNTKTDSTITNTSLRFFAIYDQLLGNVKGLNNTEQILLYLPNNDDSITLNDRMRQISIIQGIHEFSSSFNENKQNLNYIELDNTEIIFSTFEDRFNFILAINLTKMEENDGKTITYDRNLPLSYLSGLVSECYDQFRLHNGTITSLFESMDNEQLKSFLERWWIIWYQNFQFDLKENGFLKNYTDYYKKSSARLDNGLKEAIESLHESSNFKEFLIWNTAYDGNSGLIYEHFKSMDHMSKKRLLNWIEISNYYGLNPESLLSQNIIKVGTFQDKDNEAAKLEVASTEFTYDPFKLMYHTITEISKRTSIATGINYGLDTVNSGFNMVTTSITSFNKYIPWKSAAKKESEPVTAVESFPIFDANQPRFLIGKINDTSITYKQLYLQFGQEDEKLHRIVVFQNTDYLIILIYEFTANELNEEQFYDKFLVKLTNFDKFQLDTPLTKAHFYYIGIDRKSNSILSNLPEIPKRKLDEEHDKCFLNLCKSCHQVEIIHKELIHHFNTPTGLDKQLQERLYSTRNGWWIYNIEEKDKTVFILKKRKHTKESLRVLNVSTSANNVIGKDASAWLEEYLKE